MTDRPGYIAGLRALADLLEQHDEIPLPSSPGTRRSGGVQWYLFGDKHEHADQKARAAEMVRLIPGRFEKYETGDLFRFGGSLAGLPVEIIVDRPAVCERVVTGTREVKREVTIPVETRTETVTETVEDVEWVCQPLTAPVAS